MKITFDESARGFILESFGKNVRDGFIVEKDKPSEKVITPRGEEVAIKDFAGVRRVLLFLLNPTLFLLLRLRNL